MADTAYIITGTNRGLGKALVDQILASEPSAMIFALGRTLHNDHRRLKKVRFVRCNLADVSSLAKKLAAFLKSIRKHKQVVFVNNAGSIQPIGLIGQLKGNGLVDSVNVNALAPCLIANQLLRDGKVPIKLVNISTGAASKPIVGWASYCSSKAYTKMFFDVLALQFAGNKMVEVIQIDPGVLDTGMQEQVRSSTVTAFPRVDDFIQLQKLHKLKPPEEAAREILKRVTTS